MDGELIFEELPPKAIGPNRQYPEPSWRQALRDRPGEWARIPIRYTGTSGATRAMPGFEFVARTVDGEKRVYGRYVGEVS